MSRWNLPVSMVLFALALAPASGRAQLILRDDGPPLSLKATMTGKVIDALCTHLQEEYVFPDTAARLIKALRKHQAEKAYDTVPTGQELAKLLTRQLQDVAHDKHLRVWCSTEKLEPMPKRQKPSPAQQARRQLMDRKMNAGYIKVERLPGNIGYLRLDMFAGAEAAAEPAAAAMDFLAGTDALIIDLRHNGGGSPHGVALLCSYLFDAKPVHLNSLYWRQGNRTEDFYTLAKVPGKRYLHKPVYVLTSRRTFSGAEEFCYNLQTRKRATIVGETTGGGAHPGGFVPLDEHFGAFIPTGRAINPITHTNWEGHGVQPDVRVPAEQALAKARALAFQKVLADTKDPTLRELLKMEQEREKRQTTTARQSARP